MLPCSGSASVHGIQVEHLKRSMCAVTLAASEPKSDKAGKNTRHDDQLASSSSSSNVEAVSAALCCVVLCCAVLDLCFPCALNQVLFNVNKFPVLWLS